jgi:hypothetical protein
MKSQWHCGKLALILLSGFIVAGSQSKKTDPINIADYVPLTHERTWTYQWTVRYGDGRQETKSRTKSFEGPEFLPTGYAYRFVSDLGDYALLSVENQTLRLHGAVELNRAIRFNFDPPIVLYSPEMKFGKSYSVTQPMEEGTGERVWTTVVDGFEDVPTPMGQFRQCLKIRLEMNGPDVRTKSVNYYAAGIGVVAYRYEVWVSGKERPELAIEAGLKLAELGGHTVTNVSQLEALKISVTGNAPRRDDPGARKMFRQAYERLYLWPAKFPGFQADFTFIETQDLKPKTQDQNPPAASRHPPSQDGGIRGTITVLPDFKMNVSCENKPAGVQVQTEMSQFIAHLKDRPFDGEFGAAILSFGDRDPAQGTQINVSAEHTMGTSYRVRNGTISQIGQSYGRVRFVVNHTEYVKTDDGRLIPASYRITYHSNETDQMVGQADFQDECAKVENLWLPKKRVKTETVKGQTTTSVVEFSNHRILK